jgi:integrase
MFYPRWMRWLERWRGPSTQEILLEMLDELAHLQRSQFHIYGLKNMLEPFARKFPRLEKVTERGITAYLRELPAQAGERRRDNIMAAILQFSRFAKRRNYLPEERPSAAEKVKKVYHRRAWLNHAKPIAVWTLPEAKLLLEHVSPRWLPCVALGLFAGLRSSEILRLDWSAIKFDQRVIAISSRVARKTRLSRLVPISDNLLTWLQPYRDRVGPVYPGNFKTNENARCLEMVRLRRVTGLPRKDNAARHGFGSHRLALVKSFEQVATEMGNSPRIVRENYNDPKPEAEAISYFQISRPDFSKIVPMSLDLEFT